MLCSCIEFKHTIEVIKISRMYIQKVLYLEFRILYILCRLYIIFYRICLTKYIPAVTSAVSIKTTTIYIQKNHIVKLVVLVYLYLFRVFWHTSIL